MMEHVVNAQTQLPAPAPAPARKIVGGGKPRRDNARAVVGGIEFTVGGWGSYEIARRNARWAAVTGGSTQPALSERPGSRYPDANYVYADDAVRSIMRARKSVLARAAGRLSTALGRLEDRLCDPDPDGVWECASGRSLQGGPAFITIPPVTSADLRDFATDDAQQIDPRALSELGEDVLATVATLGEALPALPSTTVPALPVRAVPVSDNEAVLRLEAASAPYVTSIEGLQAALASRLDAAATIINDKMDKFTR